VGKELEPFCFWCGGNARWDFVCEPRPFYPDRQAMCANCHDLCGNGILLFELTEKNPGCNNPVRIADAVYYTGRWAVIDDETAAKLFGPDKLPGVLCTRIAGMRDDNYAAAGFAKYPWRTIQ
jgi:hypothetical protein